MKLKKDTLYTIIDTDFEKLHIYPNSGYTVWQKYDSNCDWWCAIPTRYIFDDLEKFVVSDDEDEITFDTDGVTDFLTQSLYGSDSVFPPDLHNGRYGDSAIIHDESDSDHDFAYYVGEDEVDEDVNGHRKAGYHLHLRGEDEDIVTSEEVCCYYLGGTEEYNEGTMYFKDGFSQPPISINDLFVDFD